MPTESPTKLTRCPGRALAALLVLRQLPALDRDAPADATGMQSRTKRAKDPFLEAFRCPSSRPGRDRCRSDPQEPFIRRLLGCLEVEGVDFLAADVADEQR